MSTRCILTLGFTLAVAAIGLWLALQSPILARGAADSMVRSSGGSTSTDIYLAVLDAYAAAYRLVGAVLLAVGAFFSLHLVTRHRESQ